MLLKLVIPTKRSISITSAAIFSRTMRSRKYQEFNWKQCFHLVHMVKCDVYSCMCSVQSACCVQCEKWNKPEWTDTTRNENWKWSSRKKRKFANMQTAFLLHTTSDTYVSRAMVYAQDELYRWSNATGSPLASFSHLHSVACRFALVNGMESEDCSTQVKTYSMQWTSKPYSPRKRINPI